MSAQYNMDYMHLSRRVATSDKRVVVDEMTVR